MTGFGFRPALTDIALGAPIDADHGADPKEPQTLLAAPSVRVTRALLDTWNESKRGVDAVVVFDRSGSMAGARLKGAREGLLAFLGRLRPNDQGGPPDLQRRHRPAHSAGEPDDDRPPGAGHLRRRPDGALRRDLARTRSGRRLEQDGQATHPRRGRADRRRGQPLAASSSRASWRSWRRRNRAAFGCSPSATEAKQAKQALRQIAERTGGAYYHGDVDNIRSVYEEIASFF